MRERIAIMVCVLAVVTAAAGSLIFAMLHNTPRDAPRTAPTRPGTNRPASPATGLVLPAPTNLVESAQTNLVEATVQLKADTTAARGQEIYEASRCSSCHSIEGKGNPRSPLDGVGSRRAKNDLVHWITGSGPAAEGLSSGIVRRKQRYSDLPSTDLTALAEYLSTLKNGAAQESDGSPTNPQNLK